MIPLSGILSGFSGGQWRLLGGSLALALLGLFWQVVDHQKTGTTREIITESDYARESHQSRAVRPWTSDKPAQKRAENPPARVPSWGNAAMRLGICLFVGMMLASLLKMFIKTMVMFLLLVGGALLFMEHRGLIEPFWDHDIGFLISAKDWLAGQTETVTAFLKGYLPSTGAATTGFFLGLRR